MAQQAVGFVLGQDVAAADARIDAVGQREIDDPIFAAKGNGGLRPPIGQLFQPAATPAGQHEGDHAFVHLKGPHFVRHRSASRPRFGLYRGVL